MITGITNQQMRNIRDLLSKSRERRIQHRFVAEGSRMVSETPPELLDSIYVSESFYRERDKCPGIDLSGAVIVRDDVFDRISDTRSPQGILAVVRCTDRNIYDILEQRKELLLFLENIQDPGNLGTMLRTAEGAGADGVIIGGNSADIYNPKTVRSTMGSLYRMPFAYTDDICKAVSYACSLGILVYAADLEGSICYDEADYRGPSGFLIGNEGNGLTEEALLSASGRVRIPMGGHLESLNASAAAAVLLYEARRQKKQANSE